MLTLLCRQFIPRAIFPSLHSILNSFSFSSDFYFLRHFLLLFNFCFFFFFSFRYSFSFSYLHLFCICIFFVFIFPFDRSLSLPHFQSLSQLTPLLRVQLLSYLHFHFISEPMFLWRNAYGLYRKLVDNPCVFEYFLFFFSFCFFSSASNIWASASGCNSVLN